MTINRGGKEIKELEEYTKKIREVNKGGRERRKRENEEIRRNE